MNRICRRLLTVFWVALALASSACNDAQPAANQTCVDSMNAAFAAVAVAQREDIARCVELGRLDEATTSVEACIADDEEGKVADAKQETLSVEASACRSAPAFGYSSGETVNAEASAAEVDLVHDLFGADLDATIATGAGGDCQQAVLTLVGDCTDAFLNDYNLCAKSALEAGATDEVELVQCKGADGDGAVAEACGTAIDDALDTACAGQDLDVLVPGCAGVNHAVCLAAKAVGEPSQALNASAAICEPIDLGLPPAPDPEPVLAETLPLPAEVLFIDGADYLSDDETILASINTAAGGADPEEKNVATFKEDGTEFNCITCGGAPIQGRNLRALDAQRAINRRVVLECSPSLLDCQSHAVLPLVYPTIPGTIQDRPLAMWESPDGNHIGWTHFTATPVVALDMLGELVRCTDATEAALPGCDPANDADRYEIEDIEVIGGDRAMFTESSGSLSIDLDRAQGEFKGFFDGGRSMVYYVTREDGNWDLVKIDIETRNVTRLTRHVELDEVTLESPDAQWFVVSSTRPLDRQGAFSELRRPPLGSPGNGVQIQAFRLQINDPPPGNRADRYWHNILLDRHGDRGFDNNGTGYIGQDLSDAPENFNEWGVEQGMSWKSDSTAFIWLEVQRHDLGGGKRLRKATFTSRAPTQPLAPVTPVAPWAQRLDQPGGLVFPPSGVPSGTLAGQVSGHATWSTVNGPGLPLPSMGTVSIEYSNYSDDGRSFLNGTEFIDADIFSPDGTSWDSNLKAHGCRQQSLETSDMALFAPIFVSFTPEFEGLVRSVNEGNVIEEDLSVGLPTGEPGVRN